MKSCQPIGASSNERYGSEAQPMRQMVYLLILHVGQVMYIVVTSVQVAGKDATWTPW